eukprot:3002200-Alexandrium_andersonii.AAC.1
MCIRDRTRSRLPDRRSPGNGIAAHAGGDPCARYGRESGGSAGRPPRCAAQCLSLIHISEPTRLALI